MYRYARQTSLGLIALILFAGSALAWKPKTHLYLAELARQDAIDGMITIEQTDFWGGPTGQVVGQFPVDPIIRAALATHPEYYRAGIIGPDGYPDIMTGQIAIHPGTNNLGGTNAWLQHLWRAMDRRDLRQVAFIVGYLGHAGGDIYAHTLVNHHAGGAFTYAPPENAATHLTVEGYIGQRTPDLTTVGINTHDADDVLNIAGLEGLIHDRLVAERTEPMLAQLLGSARGQTFVGMLNALRKELLSLVNGYYAEVRRLRGRVRTAGNVFSRGFWAAALAGYRLVAGPFTGYMEAWVADIDDGLLAWPSASHDVAQALFAQPGDRADWRAAQDRMESYLYGHAISMLGAPDIVGDVLGLTDRVLDVLADVLSIPIFDAIKRGLLSFILDTAFGYTLGELEDMGRNPATWIVRMHGAQKLADVNRQMGLPATPAMGQTFDWRAFPAAYNTVTALKLSFLDRATLGQVYGAIGCDGICSLQGPAQNVLLGYIRNIDDSNEWSKHAEVMPLMQDCALYMRLFVNQPGEDHDAGQQHFHYAHGQPALLTCPYVIGVDVVPAINTHRDYCGDGAVDIDVQLSHRTDDGGGVVWLDGIVDTQGGQSAWPEVPDRIHVSPGHQGRTLRVDIDNRHALASGHAHVDATRLTSASGSVEMRPPAIADVVLDDPEVVNGETVRGYVELDCAPPTVARTATVSSPMLAQPITVTFPANSTRARFSFETDCVPQHTDTQVTATYLGDRHATALRVLSSGIKNIALSPDELRGYPNHTIVTLDICRGPQIHQALTYDLQFNRAELNGPATLTVPGHHTQGTARLDLARVPNHPAAIAETIRITAQADGTHRDATLIISNHGNWDPERIFECAFDPRCESFATKFDGMDDPRMVPEGPPGGGRPWP